MLLLDPLTTDFYYDDNSLENIQESVFDKLINLLNMKEIQLEEEEISQIAVLGKVLGNNELVSLFNKKLKEYENNINIENVIGLIKQKISFDLPIEELRAEISFISSNFTKFIDKLIELGKDDKYYNLIESIVKNEHLLLYTEDELLLFIIKLCEENNIYEMFFEFVMLEYCSVEAIKIFIEYINKYICKNYSHKSILKCINRRIAQEKIPLENKDIQRYKALIEKPQDFEADIFKACKEGKLTSVQWLIEEDNVDKYIKDKNSDTPIHIASENGHLPIVQYLIEKQNVDINIKGCNERTPLHKACVKGHLPVVKYLISNGANIEAKKGGGYTPLHNASDYDYPDIVKYLISKGANKNAKGNDGNTPYYFAKNDEIRNILK